MGLSRGWLLGDMVAAPERVNMVRGKHGSDMISHPRVEPCAFQ